MSAIANHRTIWRIGLLVLLAVSFAGPWYVTSDGVPPAEWCRDPLILLQNGQCVDLVSGAFVLLFTAATLPSIAVQIAEGAELAGRGREFLAVFLFTALAWAIVQPFASTLLAMLRPARRARVYNLVAWGIAAVLPAALLAAAAPPELLPHLWGLWLYAGTALAGFALEWTLLRARREPLV